MDKVRNSIKLFEIGSETFLGMDWRKTVIGYVLKQKHCKCPIDKVPFCREDHWRHTAIGSRFLKDAERRYAPIEGAAIAMVYGLQTTRMYMMGKDKLTVGVDH